MTSDIAISNSKRIFFLGVNTGYVIDGLPDERYVEFYRQRASPLLYCAIVGNVVVPGGFGSNDATPTLTDDGIWQTVARAIAERKTLPGIQLATAWKGYKGNQKFVGMATGEVIAEARARVKETGSAGIKSTLDAFDKAAQVALRHGFLHVQCHAAHGYLLSLLVDDRINPEAPYVLDRLAELAVRLRSEGSESSIRFSLKTGDAAFDSEGREAFHERMCHLPFDYIDLSSGFYNIDKRLIYPSLDSIRKDRLAESRSLAERYPSKSFIFSGRAAYPDSFDLPRNMQIGICRDLIANPDFLANPAQGCRNRSKCHYFVTVS